MLKKILLIAICLGISSFAYASKDAIYAPIPLKGFVPAVYVGLQGGFGATNWDHLNDNIGAIKFSVSGSNAPVGRFYVGYDWRPHLSIEGGYTQFFNDTKITLFPNNAHYSWAMDVSLKIKFNLMDSFGLFTKVGFDYFNTSLGNGSTGDEVPVSAYNALFGAGATLHVTNNFDFDLSWTRFGAIPKWQSNHVPYADMYAIGLSYRFNLR